MPTYTWRCETCARIKEHELTIREYSEIFFGKTLMCERCAGKMTRVINAGGFQLGGLGWPGKAARRRAQERRKDKVK